MNWGNKGYVSWSKVADMYITPEPTPSVLVETGASPLRLIKMRPRKRKAAASQLNGSAMFYEMRISSGQPISAAERICPGRKRGLNVNSAPSLNSSLGRAEISAAWKWDRGSLWKVDKPPPLICGSRKRVGDCRQKQH